MLYVTVDDLNDGVLESQFTRVKSLIFENISKIMKDLYYGQRFHIGSG